MESNFDVASIYGILRGPDVTTLEFTKADGSVRVMKATLNESLIPAAPVTDGEKPKRVHTSEAIRVYDVEAQGWRSFLPWNLISINGEPAYAFE